MTNQNPVGKSYKAKLKSELADAAGVSTRTFARWLQHPMYAAKLADMGVTPKSKLLPPQAVRYICDTFCIDI